MSQQGGISERPAKMPCRWLIVALFVQLAVNIAFVVGWVVPQQRISQREMAPVDKGLEMGVVAPSFSLPAVDGGSVSLGEVSGGRSLLAFSSVDCPYCEEMYPVLREFQEEQGVDALTVLSFGSDEENRRLADEVGFARVGHLNREAAMAFEVPGTPFFYVIEDGLIVNKGFATTGDDLRKIWEGLPDQTRAGS